MFQSLKGRGNRPGSLLPGVIGFEHLGSTTTCSPWAERTLGLKSNKGGKTKQTTTEGKAKFEPSSTYQRFKEGAVPSAPGGRCVGVCVPAGNGEKEQHVSGRGGRALATRSRNVTRRACPAAGPSQLSLEFGRNSCFVWCHSPSRRDRRTHTVSWHVFLLGNTEELPVPTSLAGNQN